MVIFWDEKEILDFFRKIEKKWNKIWKEKKIYEPEIDPRKPKFFVTVPYPYMSGLLHLGSAYTFTRGDFIARFKRLKGYNVLWPQGWHITGAPIVSKALRLSEGDPKIIKELRDAGIPESEWDKLKTPEGWAMKFIELNKKAFKEFGYSIDWRREFYTTYLNPWYNKFVQWQYRKLKEKGLITKGKHPVVWDPKVNKVIGDHDRPDEYAGISPIEGYIIKFEGELNNRKLIFPCFTLRPETVYGVTNIWINPEAKYAIYKVNNEYWILPKTIVIEELRNQDFEVEFVEDINTEELLGKYVENPVTKEKVPILPARFVDPEIGTGIVMSVPAHAPYDYIALKDLILEFEDYKGVKVNKKVLEKTKELDNEIKNLNKIIAVTGLITDEERVYLVKRAPWKKFLANKWFFVGGRIEKGESILDALIREVKEETKSEINKIIDYLGYIDYEDGRIYIFLITLKSKPLLDKKEHTEEIWIDLDYIEKYTYKIPEEVKEVIEKSRFIVLKLKFSDIAKRCLENMRSLFKLEGFSEFPAKDIVERMGIKSQEEKEKLEKATQKIYSEEFYKGILKDIFGKYSGKKICEIKEEFEKELVEKCIAVKYYTLPLRFKSRYGGTCIVKIVKDQWFLRYSDPEWKKLAHECIDSMEFYPKEIKETLHQTVDWYKDWACAHQKELGTPLPWDPEWTLESLSDSTIYMAYYTIAHLIKEIPPEKIEDDLFDYVFLGKENEEELVRKYGEIIKRMREEFLYWYPVDLRTSGKDLLQNHFIFYIFHHVAIFPKEFWPRKIIVNGWILMEGRKMSKSLGNYISMLEAIEKYPVTAIRFLLALAGNSGFDDANIEISKWKEVLEDLYEFYNFAIKNYNKGREEKRIIDEWFENIIYKVLNEVEEEYEKMNFKNVLVKGYYELRNKFKWYMKRTNENPNREVLNRYIEALTILVYPIAPHFSSEILEKIRGKDYALNPRWVEAKEVNEEIIKAEEFVMNLREDIIRINNIAKLEKINEIKIIVAREEKYKIFDYAKEVIEREGLRNLVRRLVERFGKENVWIGQRIFRDPGLLENYVNREIELKALEEAKEFLEREFGAKVAIELEEESKEEKAKQALPGKPAIILR